MVDKKKHIYGARTIRIRLDLIKETRLTLKQNPAKLPIYYEHQYKMLELLSSDKLDLVCKMIQLIWHFVYCQISLQFVGDDLSC